MKGFGGTLLAALLVGGLAYYSYYELERSEAEKEAQDKADLIYPDIKPEDVVELKIEQTLKVAGSSGTAALVLKKEGANWQMLEPLTDEGDSGSLETYLTDVLGEKVKALKLPDGQQKWDLKAYGLDQPEGKIQFKTSATQEHSIEVGSVKAFDGSRFLLIDGRKDQVFLGEKPWGSLSTKVAKDLRRKKVFPPGEVLEMKISGIKNGPRLAVFKKAEANGQWQLADANGPKLRSLGISDYIENIKALSASDFVAEDLKPATLKKYGLERPLKVTWKIKNKDQESEWDFYLSGLQGNYYYGYSSLRPTVYQFAKYTAEKLDQAWINFRDKAYPFQFDQKLIKTVNIKSDKTNLKIAKNADGKWSFATEVPEYDLDISQLERLLTRIKELEVEQFSSGKRKLGRTNTQLSFTDQDDREFFALSWGDRQEARQSQRAVYSVVSSLEPKELLNVDVISIDALPVDQLLKKKVADPKVKQQTQRPASDSSAKAG